LGKRSCSSSPGGIREDCGPAVQGAAKMVDKTSRKRAGEELAPALKRQRQEQQGPRCEAALPPPLQMGFVHGGSRGNNPRRGGGRIHGRGRCVGVDSLRGCYGLGDG
jgi:hypothetical protein